MHESKSDASRPRSRTSSLLLRGLLVVAAVILVSGLGGSFGRARAADIAAPVGSEMAARELNDLKSQLESARGELAVAKLQVERANAIMDYSRRYQVPADLSSAIYDIALSEGIDPSLGFRLVRVESNFILKAHSNKNAIGYTQIRPATARFYSPDISEEKLFDRETNLRLGFRFLKDLMRRYNSNLELALLAYNRGPGTVDQIVAEGGNPTNGYEDAVLRGYRSKPAPATIN
ncbi:MAG: transglycosylase SLT domain-containing protein [Gemmatimonadota bacterium]